MANGGLSVVLTPVFVTENCRVPLLEHSKRMVSPEHGREAVVYLQRAEPGLLVNKLKKFQEWKNVMCYCLPDFMISNVTIAYSSSEKLELMLTV